MLVLCVALIQATASVSVESDISIIQARMLERLKRDAQRQVRGASWTKDRLDEDISDPKSSKVEHQERYRVWGDGTRVLQRKTSRDGRLVREKAEPLPFFLEPSMLARFQFKFATPREVPCGDHSCWMLAFAPRSGEVDRSDDPERTMLTASVGTVLVDKASHVILRVEGRMTTPHRSFLYTVLWSRVTITQAMHNGVMIVATIEIRFAYDPFLGGVKTKRRFYRTLDVALPPS